MDGLMEPRTIQYINLIRNTDNVKVIFNQRLPRTDYTLKLYQYHSSQFQYVIDMYVDYLKQGKRIYGMITQKKLGNYIQEKIIELTGKTCIFYNGDNLKYDDNMVSHKE